MAHECMKCVYMCSRNIDDNYCARKVHDLEKLGIKVVGGLDGLIDDFGLPKVSRHDTCPNWKSIEVENG